MRRLQTSDDAAAGDEQVHHPPPEYPEVRQLPAAVTGTSPELGPGHPSSEAVGARKSGSFSRLTRQ